MLQSKKDEISKGGPAPTTQGRLLDKNKIQTNTRRTSIFSFRIDQMTDQ